MAENRFPYVSSSQRETCCIDTNRVLDCCRDRDCFEDVRVYLSDFGNEVVENSGQIRAKDAEIIWTQIAIDPIQFNRGFYAITIRFYVHVTCETCSGPARAQEINGICILEKRVILYGGESRAIIYKSGEDDGFCSLPNPSNMERKVPTAYVEVVDPVLLGAKIAERRGDFCGGAPSGEIPERVLQAMDAPITFEDIPNRRRYLTVSLGIFSVVRLARPTQLLIQANEYIIPEKECIPVEEDDPCSVFRAMPFPSDEFGSDSARTEKSARCNLCGS